MSQGSATLAPSLHREVDDVERVLDRARFENFPVASRVLPAAWRIHLMAIYGFARLVDDIGDEASGDRLAQIDALEADLERIYRGAPRHPLLQRLAPTVEECSLPIEPFRRLIEANRRDQVEKRYASFDALLDYCRLSANPVGELVLHVFGAATPERIALSDSVCSGLQLVEHCQDVAEDWAQGRVYLPRDEMRSYGCDVDTLSRPAASPELRSLLAFQVERVRSLLEPGVALVASLGGRQRLAVAGFVGGGYAAAAAIERVDFDVLGGAPRARRRDRMRYAIGVLRNARRGDAGSAC